MVDPYLVGIVLLQAIVCLYGFIVNVFFVHVVTRHKKLRANTCGLLLLVLAVYDAITESGLILFPPVLHLTNTAIPLLRCFWLEFYIPFTDFSSYFIIFWISLDRLLGVLFSIEYRWFSKKHKGKQVAFLLFITTIPPSYMTALFHEEVRKTPDLQVHCLPTDFISGDPGQMFQNISIFCFGLALANHAVIWLLLRIKTFSNAQSGQERRILKSLLVIMGVILFCWLPSPLAKTFLLPILPISAQLNTNIYRLLILLKKVAAILNVPVLFINNPEYRRAMRKEAKAIFKYFFGLTNPSSLSKITVGQVM